MVNRGISLVYLILGSKPTKPICFDWRSVVRENMIWDSERIDDATLEEVQNAMCPHFSECDGLSPPCEIVVSCKNEAVPIRG